MFITVNGKNFNVLYVSDAYNTANGTREMSFDIEGEVIESIYKNIKAHGANNPITLTRNNKDTIILDGYSAINSVTRNITSDMDTIRLVLAIPDSGENYSNVNDPEATEEAESEAEPDEVTEESEEEVVEEA